LLLAGGTISVVKWTSARAAEGGTCPPGYILYAALEPIQDDTQSSKVTEQGCKPVESLGG